MDVMSGSVKQPVDGFILSNAIRSAAAQIAKLFGARVIATAGYVAQTDLRYLFMRELSIMGAHVGSKAELIQILKEMERGTLTPVVDPVFPLREAGGAQRAVEDRKL